MRTLAVILFSLCIWSNWSYAQSEAACSGYSLEVIKLEIQLFNLNELIDSLETTISLMASEDADRPVVEQILKEKQVEYGELFLKFRSLQLCL